MCFLESPSMQMMMSFSNKHFLQNLFNINKTSTLVCTSYTSGVTKSRFHYLLVPVPYILPFASLVSYKSRYHNEMIIRVACIGLHCTSVYFAMHEQNLSSITTQLPRNSGSVVFCHTQKIWKCAVIARIRMDS
jgi:hypothetical protein